MISCHLLPSDNLWPSDIQRFKFAYAIKLKNNWMVKKPGGEWTKRNAGWTPSDESTFCKYWISFENTRRKNTI